MDIPKSRVTLVGDPHQPGAFCDCWTWNVTVQWGWHHPMPLNSRIGSPDRGAYFCRVALQDGDVHHELRRGNVGNACFKSFCVK